MTIDEAAIIQTFPLDYIFEGPQSRVFSQIGNAVPCGLAEAVFKAVRMALDGKSLERSQPQLELKNQSKAA